MASPYFFGPCPDRADGLAEGEAEVGEPVLDTGRHFREVSADDDAVTLQGAQRAGEYLGGHPGDGLAQFGETATDPCLRAKTMSGVHLWVRHSKRKRVGDPIP
jgi:hypothetical protein